MWWLLWIRLGTGVWGVWDMLSWDGGWVGSWMGMYVFGYLASGFLLSFRGAKPSSLLDH